MNVHHLELFYHVARHGGISRAVRHMPYGIQQPAVSSQILQLEQDLGAKLFDRQPFRLTTEGQELYAFARPFFDQLETVGARLRARRTPKLRIAASELVLRDYLPPVIQEIQRTRPTVGFVLRSGYQAAMEDWLQEGLIDLAITPLESRPRAGLKCSPIVSFPLVLLVPKNSPITTAGQLWSKDRIDEPLISLPPTESLTRLFQKGLRQLKVDWPTSIEASSVGLVSKYVENGYGIGVSIVVPHVAQHPGVRLIPLSGFERLAVVALWQPPLTALPQELLAVVQRRARALWPADDAPAIQPAPVSSRSRRSK